MCYIVKNAFYILLIGFPTSRTLSVGQPLSVFHFCFYFFLIKDIFDKRIDRTGELPFHSIPFYFLCALGYAVRFPGYCTKGQKKECI